MMDAKCICCGKWYIRVPDSFECPCEVEEE